MSRPAQHVRELHDLIGRLAAAGIDVVTVTDSAGTYLVKQIRPAADCA